MPEAVFQASASFVELQWPAASNRASYFAGQAVLFREPGLVLASLIEINRYEDSFLFDPSRDYQAAVYSPGTNDAEYVPLRRVASIPELDLIMFVTRHGESWPFALIADQLTVEPGDEVFSIGIDEVERWTRSTAASTSGPQVINGAVVAVEENNGLVEIVHSSDLSTIPGFGPLLDSSGRLVGVNIRATRRFGPDGPEPVTYALSSDEFAAAIQAALAR